MILIICREIRKVKGGYIVECRWPYGPEPSGYGEVICVTWQDVIELLTKAANGVGSVE